VLEVVDVVTRRRIPHVEVHAVEEQRYGQDDAILPPDHPARPLAGRPSVETRSNPMELANWIEEGWFPDWQPVRKWWIRAPGYAWKRVEIDHTVGGRIVVELAPRR